METKEIVIDSVDCEMILRLISLTRERSWSVHNRHLLDELEEKARKGISE